MSLLIKEFFRVSCDICDWTKTYGSYHQIPQNVRDGKCPSCGSNREDWTSKWNTTKEEIHNRIRERVGHLA